MKRAWDSENLPETRITTGPGCARSDVIHLQPENVGDGGFLHRVTAGYDHVSIEAQLRDCLATHPINRIVNQAPLCTAFDYYRSAEEVSDKRRDILVPCSRMVYVRNLYSIDVIESARQTFSLLPSGGAKHGNLGCLFLF
jgi:hypothetical protein